MPCSHKQIGLTSVIQGNDQNGTPLPHLVLSMLFPLHTAQELNIKVVLVLEMLNSPLKFGVQG